jgi:hypothetical protein
MPTVWPRSPALSQALTRLGVRGFYAVSNSPLERSDLVHHLETIAPSVAVLSVHSGTQGIALADALPRLRELELREPGARLPPAPQLERLTLVTTRLEAVAEPLPCLRELACNGHVSASDWPLLSPPTLWRLSCYTLPSALPHADLTHLKDLTLHMVNDALLGWLVEHAALPELESLELPEGVSERWSCRLLERFGATLRGLNGPWLGREAFELLMAGGAVALAAMTFVDLSDDDFRRLRRSELARRLVTLRWIGRLEVESVETLLDLQVFPSLKYLWLDGRVSQLPRALAERLVHRFGPNVFL